MKKAKRAKKKPVQSKTAAKQLWAHVKQQMKVDEALASLSQEDASRSAFKVKQSPTNAILRRESL